MAEKEATNSEQPAVIATRSDLLSEWSYASDYLLHVLDPNLIESHAINILSRALNIGRTVAFVGAGASMAYGRLSWGGLLQALIADVNRSYEDLQAEKRKSTKKDDVVPQLIDSMHQTLTALAEKGVRPEHNPMLFQLCEQLDYAIETERQAGWFKNPVNRARTRRKTQSILFDDLGHARQIISDALRAVEKEKEELKKKEGNDTYDEEYRKKYREIDGNIEKYIRHDTKNTIYTPTTIDIITSDRTLQKYIRPIIDILKQCFSNNESKSELPLLPIDRYLIGSLIRAHTIDWAGLETIFKNREIDPKTFIDPSAPPPALSRHQRHPLERDPLMLLRQKLAIERFITTNYDREIELMFEDQGLFDRSSIKTSQDYSKRNLQADTFDSVVFSKQSVVDMFEFVSRERHGGAGVFHLHGRAQIDTDASNIIVTENDYQSQYTAIDETRDIVDAAIRTAFAANPILFVGSNMGEDDIMRPLRQFMGASNKLGDRAAVALLPRIKSEAETTEEKIALLARYGVYAIHYGLASFETPANPPHRDTVVAYNAMKAASSYWLPWVWQLKTEIEGALKCIIDGGELDTTDIRNTIDRAFEIKNRDEEKKRKREKDYYEGKPDREIEPKGYNFPKLNTPTSIEFIRTGKERDRSTPDVSLEVDLLNTVLSFVSEALQAGTVTADVQHAAKVFRDVLAGVGNSLQTSFVCARIERASWDWEVWKTRWWLAPRPREIWRVSPAGAPVGSPPYPPHLRNGIGNTVIRDWPPAGPDKRAEEVTHYLWHGTSVADKVRQQDIDDSNTYVVGRRFYGDAPSQGLRGLISALASQSPARQLFREITGRRFLVLIAPRGVGKGHIFAMLQGTAVVEKEKIIRHHKRLSEFLEALYKTSERGKIQWVCVIYNLSFAHDVMSPIDRIIDIFEYEMLLVCSDGDRPKVIDNLNCLAPDRLRRLKYVLDTWKDAALAKRCESSGQSSPQRRVLVALNSLSVFFEAGGYPKNGQIKRLFRILTDDSYFLLPIDFVFLCDPERVPRLFRHSNPAHLVREPIDEARRLDAEKLYNHIKLPPKQPRVSNVAIHVLQVTRASTLVAAFFPRALFLMARQEILSQPCQRDQADYPALFSSPLSDDTRHAVQLLQDDLDSSGDGSIFNRSELLPALFALFSYWAEFETDFTEQQFHAFCVILKCNAETFATSGTQKSGWESFCGEVADLPYRQPPKAELPPPVPAEKIACVAKAAQQLDERLRRLSRALNGSRYGLTLFCAAAYELTTDLSNPQDGTGSQTPKKRRDAVSEATHKLDRFVARVLQTLETTDAPSRFDKLLREYLNMLQRHHDRGVVLPIKLRLGVKKNEGADGRLRLLSECEPRVLSASKIQYELMLEVLQHIAVIGQPVRCETLALCPRIETLALAVITGLYDGAKHPAPTPLNDTQDVPHVICEIMALLEHRCLVLRVASANIGGDDSILKARFTVHHRVQRHLFRMLGGQQAEIQNVDLYIVTLYTTQPSELPRLSADAYRQMTNTIEHLLGYPDRSGWHDAHAKLSIQDRSRMLRAAFGIMRSIYSIGVLSRLDQFGAMDGPDAATHGHFERYRRMLRWLLLSAAELDRNWAAIIEKRQTQVKDTESPPPNGDPDSQNTPEYYSPPLYADEIVWIYNECAVLSLIEGRLNDAGPLFDAGIQFARRTIEPDRLGPLNLRLSLNRAIAQIERGQLQKAKAALVPIAEVDLAEEHPSPKWIALGYLGLIDQLSGQLDPAEEKLSMAFKELEKLGRMRACSIFARYLSDRGRIIGTEASLGEARVEAEKALRLAHEGGHEDIRHYAQIARIKIMLKAGEHTEKSSEIFSSLDVIEHYAAVVGVPRLICEVSNVRTRLLLQQGERRQAVSQAAKALEVANRNDLRLIKVTSLGVLGVAIAARGMQREAMSLLKAALDLAKATGHTLAQTRLERQLEALAQT